MTTDSDRAESYELQVREMEVCNPNHGYDSGYNEAVFECTKLAASADAALAAKDAEIERLKKQRQVRLNGQRRVEDECADQERIIERQHARIRELEDNDAIGKRLTDGHLARIAELEAVVGKLPHTADHVPLVPLTQLFHPSCPDKPVRALAVPTLSMNTPTGPGEWIDHRDCYSTEEAARAAAEQQNSKEAT